MKPPVPKPQRCAIYTRKSTEHNLDLEFNSLDAQREACEAYIKSQALRAGASSPITTRSQRTPPGQRPTPCPTNSKERASFPIRRIRHFQGRLRARQRQSALHRA
jgi:hypothetical protein